jgi:hypothetical protein
VEVNLSKMREVEFHDLTALLVPQLSSGARLDVLLVANAPVDVLEPDHRSVPTLLSGPEWLRDLGTLLPAWTWRYSAGPTSCLDSAVVGA